MSAIITRGKWTRQPPGPTRIDWSNPLATGLIGAYVPAIGRGFNRTSTGLVIPVASASQKFGSIQADRFDSAQSTFIWKQLTREYYTLGGVTVFAIVRPTTLNVHRYLTGPYYGPSEVAGSQAVWLAFTASNYADFTLYNSGGNSTTGTTALTDTTRWYALCGTCASGEYGPRRLYVDGALEATGDSGYMSQPTVRRHGVGGVMYGPYGDGPLLGTGDIAASLVWNRALTPSEVAALSANPWAIFEPAKSSRFYSIPLYNYIDEPTVRDEDFLETSTSGARVEFKLASVTDPGVDTGQILKVRAKGSGSLITELWQGAPDAVPLIGRPHKPLMQPRDIARKQPEIVLGVAFTANGSFVCIDNGNVRDGGWAGNTALGADGGGVGALATAGSGSPKTLFNSSNASGIRADAPFTFLMYGSLPASYGGTGDEYLLALTPVTNGYDSRIGIRSLTTGEMTTRIIARNNWVDVLDVSHTFVGAVPLSLFRWDFDGTTARILLNGKVLATGNKTGSLTADRDWTALGTSQTTWAHLPRFLYTVQYRGVLPDDFGVANPWGIFAQPNRRTYSLPLAKNTAAPLIRRPGRPVPARAEQVLVAGVSVDAARGVAVTASGPLSGSPIGSALQSGSSVSSSSRAVSADEYTAIVVLYCSSDFPSTSNQYFLTQGSNTFLRIVEFSSGRGLGFQAYYYPDFSGSASAELISAVLTAGVHVVAATYKRNGYAKLYLDGRLLAQNAAGDFPIGVSGATLSGIPNALAQSTRIFYRELSPGEVASISANPRQLVARQSRCTYSLPLAKNTAAPLIGRPKAAVRQPPAGTQIDWSNPITRKIAFAWSGAAMGFLAGGTPLTVGSTSIVGASPHGLALDGTGATTDVLNFPPLVVTSNGAGTGDFTLAVLSNPPSAATEYSQIAQRRDVAGYNQAFLAANVNPSTYGVTAGTMTFSTYASARSGLGVAGAVDGAWHLWVGVRSVGNMYLYKDGQLIGSTSDTVRNILGADNNGCSIGGSYPAVWPAANKVAFGGAWNRALSAAEVVALSANPWQLFAQPNRRTYSLPAGQITRRINTLPQSPALILPRKTVRQPPAGARVDWNNRYLANARTVVDLRAPIVVTKKRTGFETLSALPLVPTRMGDGASFNGSVSRNTDYIYAFRSTEKITWIAVIQPGGTSGTIMCTGGYSNPQFRLNGGGINFLNSGTAEILTVGNVAVGEAAAIAVTYDGTNARVYKNGGLVGSASNAQTFGGLTGSYLGTRESSEYFVGAILLAVAIDGVDEAAALALTENPWQVFAEPKNTIYSIPVATTFEHAIEEAEAARITDYSDRRLVLEFQDG